MYVSDVLEPLLEATATRDAVREHCARALEPLAQALERRLRPAAHYLGGKCMGYPAIWVVHLVLEPRGVSLAAIVDHTEPALSLSLTTSIVDDLLDADAPTDEEQIALLYLLMGQASFDRQHRSASVSRAQRDFLSQALEVCSDCGVGPDAAQRRGDRIGHFFRMIATGPALTFLPKTSAWDLIEATGRFGRFCAHLDDWIDLENDRGRGEAGNVALRMLSEMRKTRTVDERIRDDEMRSLTDLMEQLLTDELDAVRTNLAALDAPRALATLDGISNRVRGCLTDVRTAQASRPVCVEHPAVRRTVQT